MIQCSARGAYLLLVIQGRALIGVAVLSKEGALVFGGQKDVCVKNRLSEQRKFTIRIFRTKVTMVHIIRIQFAIIPNVFKVTFFDKIAFLAKHL